MIETKICCTCKQEKPLDEFWSYKSSVDGKQPRCKECQREYKKTTKYKAKQAEYNREYYQIPEVKQARREWKKTPEQLAKRKEYEDRPTVRARRLELNQSPRRKQYQRDWRADPENHQSVLEYRATFQEKYLMSAARKRGKQFDVPCTIAEEDIHIPETCPVLGIPITRGKGKWTNNSPSLDRLFPERGYIPENIAVISFRANALKKNGTAEEHRNISAWMRAQNPKEKMKSPIDGYIFGKTEKSLVYDATKRAKQKGLPCDIRPENIMIPDVCPILGIPLYPGKGKPHDGSPSLDRVIQELGYTLENTRVISLRANLLKRDGTAEEHLKIADWMDAMSEQRIAA